MGTKVKSAERRVRACTTSTINYKKANDDFELDRKCTDSNGVDELLKHVVERGCAVTNALLASLQESIHLGMPRDEKVHILVLDSQKQRMLEELENESVCAI